MKLHCTIRILQLFRDGCHYDGRAILGIEHIFHFFTNCLGISGTTVNGHFHKHILKTFDLFINCKYEALTIPGDVKRPADDICVNLFQLLTEDRSARAAE